MGKVNSFVEATFFSQFSRIFTVGSSRGPYRTAGFSVEQQRQPLVLSGFSLVGSEYVSLRRALSGLFHEGEEDVC